MKNILFKVAAILIITVLSIKNGYSVTNYNQIAVSKLKYTISGAYASVAPAYKDIGYNPFYPQIRNRPHKMTQRSKR